MLNIIKERQDDRLTVKLEGRLDTTTSPDLEKSLQESLPGVTELVMDFEKLDYISSAGLRVMLATQKIMNRQGGMKLCRVKDVIMEILEVSGFTDILTIE
jgi:anti-sigma B factor antagonist